MTRSRAAVVRLRKTLNEIAKENARDSGTSKEGYITQLVEAYASGDPIPVERPVRQKEPTTEIRIAVNEDVYERANRRAYIEGKTGLSAAVEWMMMHDRGDPDE